MMLYVADTHALHWYLTADRRLSRRVRALFDALGASDDHIYLPTLVLAEILALQEKGRTKATYDFVLEHVQAHPGYTIIPITLEVVETAKRVQGAVELFDRLIAATAVYLEAKLITSDNVLSSMKNIETIW